MHACEKIRARYQARWVLGKHIPAVLFFGYDEQCVTPSYVDVFEMLDLGARRSKNKKSPRYHPSTPIQGQDSRAPAPCPNLPARQMVSTHRRTHTLPLLSASLPLCSCPLPLCLSASLPRPSASDQLFQWLYARLLLNFVFSDGMQICCLFSSFLHLLLPPLEFSTLCVSACRPCPCLCMLLPFLSSCPYSSFSAYLLLCLPLPPCHVNQSCSGPPVRLGAGAGWPV
jgi:hypothetical protein